MRVLWYAPAGVIQHIYIHIHIHMYINKCIHSYAYDCCRMMLGIIGAMETVEVGEPEVCISVQTLIAAGAPRRCRHRTTPLRGLPRVCAWLFPPMGCSSRRPGTCAAVGYP